MLNIWIEYTANLKAEARIPELLNRIGRFLIDYQGGDVFPPGGTRCAGWRSRLLHGRRRGGLRLCPPRRPASAPGRPPEQMKRAFDEVFDILKDHFKELYDRRLLAIYMEVTEADPDWSWRHNNVRKHMQAKRAALAAERAEG